MQNELCWIKDTYSPETGFIAFDYLQLSPDSVSSVEFLLKEKEKKQQNRNEEEGRKRNKQKKNEYLVLPKIFSPTCLSFFVQ